MEGKKLIYLEDAVEAVEKESQVDGSYGYMDTKSIIDLLNDLPAVEPKRKTGRWSPKEERQKQEVFICSECGGFTYSPWTGNRKTPKTNWCKYAFCPSCGAKMEEPDAVQ